MGREKRRREQGLTLGHFSAQPNLITPPRVLSNKLGENYAPNISNNKCFVDECKPLGGGGGGRGGGDEGRVWVSVRCARSRVNRGASVA